MIASSECLKVSVGGLVMSARLDRLPHRLGAEDHFAPFLTDGEADMDLIFQPGVSGRRGRLIFDSGGVWSLHEEHDGRLRCDLSAPLFGPDPYAQALIEPDLGAAAVFLRTTRGHEVGGTLYPFIYPLDEILFIGLLGRRGGLHLHSAGIDDGGSGLLFPGVSGAGKSTLSKLWVREGKARVLSDDRTIIRVENGSPRIFGSPWHGEAGLSCQGSVPLRGIFFLRQAHKNEAIPMRPAEAAAELVARAFPAYWDEASVSSALEIAAWVADVVPAFRLCFRPDEGALIAAREAVR